MLPDPPLHVLTCPADFRPCFKDSAAGWKNLDHKHQAFITGTILKTGRSRQGAKWTHSCTFSVHFASCSGGRKRICGQPVDDPERTCGHGTILSRRGFQAFMARTGGKKDRQALANAFHRF